MEEFWVLRTITDQALANNVCAALEDRNIAVMLEHVELLHGNTRASGYRVLVPSDSIQLATQIFESEAKTDRTPELRVFG